MSESGLPSYLQPTSTLGAGVLIIHMDHVLLVQMNYGKFKGHWVQPGGKVELGEHPEQAAIREVREETGIEVEIIDQIGVRHRIRPDGQPADVYFLFRARICGDPISLPPPKWPKEELIEARFWPIEDALRLPNLRPQTRLMIEHSLNLPLGRILGHRSPAGSEFNDSFFLAAQN